MPGLLILAADEKSRFELEKLGESRDFRVKTTFDFNLAVEWLKLMPFDVILIDAAFDLNSQQQIADLLWAKNPVAYFILFDLERSSSADKRARVFGADLAHGEKALSHIERLLDRAVSVRRDFDRSGFKIMVVEDLDSPRDIICTYLEGIGYPDNRGFSSVKDAIGELRRAPDEYKCILTDIRMPGIDGREFIEMVRADAGLKHLPVIVLTAHGTSDCLLDCIKAGASGFLVKPPRRIDFVRELSKAVRIIARKEDPRMAQELETDALAVLMAEKGII